MTTTILTSGRAIVVGHDEFVRDDRGDIHLYDGDETILTVDSDEFVARLTGTVTVPDGADHETNVLHHTSHVP